MVKSSPKSSTWTRFNEIIQQWFSGIHKNIQGINNSKIFAGLVVVTLNIASKFVNIRLSKTVEAYLKHTFSRDVLIFCIVWMGSREIYIAAIVTLCFVIFMDFLLNEDSAYCILPESFTTYHISLLDSAAAASNSGTNPSVVDSSTGQSMGPSTGPATSPSTGPSASPSTSPSTGPSTGPGPSTGLSTLQASSTNDYKPIQWS